MTTIAELRERYSTEMALVILVCRVFFNTGQPAQLRVYLQTHAIDWDLLTRIIAMHQVRPVMYKVLSQHSDGVDKAFLDKLRETSLKIASGNLGKLHEIVRLHKVFTNAGIANIPYKGVVLSEHLYGDFITREITDIDFVVRAADFAKAKVLMEAEGYVNAYYYDPAYEKLFLASETEMMFAKPAAGKQMKVELHWDITHSMLDVSLPLDELFENSTTRQVPGNTIAWLQGSDMLLVLLVHHGVNDIWRTLRHVIDLGAYIQKEPALFNSDQLKNRLEQLKIWKTTCTGLHLCSDLLGVHASVQCAKPAAYQPVLDNLLRFPSIKRNKFSFATMKQQFALRDNFTDKLRLFGLYVRVLVAPSIRDVESLPLPRRWSFLYVLLKPFLALQRRK